MTDRIEEVRAWPISFSVPERHQVRLGIGRTVKRDAVVVRVTTGDGFVGWGEAHAARAPTAIAELVNTTLANLLHGRDPLDSAAAWEIVWQRQLASHGAGAAAAIGLSGIDLALWDIRGKQAGVPVANLLGGSARPVRAYAGGISLGFDEPERIVDEARGLVDSGFGALKLRIGEDANRDCARVEAVRTALGDAVEIMVDANTALGEKGLAARLPWLEAARVGWLEEPFPPQYYRAYQRARAATSIPLAAGENHYTRFDFERLADDAAVSVWQPDLSKTGGLTEALRIAEMGAGLGVKIHPHTSVTGLNMAASLHFLAAIDNAGFYEADVTAFNPFRDALTSPRIALRADGTYQAPDGPGWGIEVDEERLASAGVIAGPGYV